MKKPDHEYFIGSAQEKLFIQEWGSPEHPVVLLVHGFPGCAEHGRLLTSTPLVDQFRLISFDRPGYGQSHWQKKLTPLKLAQQLKNFLDSKKIDRFFVLSVSGGAPYAMALGFLLKNRVQRITSVAGVAPLSFKNFRYMNKKQKRAWILRNFFPTSLLELALNRVWKKSLDRFEKLLFTDLNTFSEPDQKVFTHPVVGPALVDSIKVSLAQGPGGILQDMKVYSKPWGFSLSDIQCPVTLWHGSQDDVVHVRFAQDMNKKVNLPAASPRGITGAI